MKAKLEFNLPEQLPELQVASEAIKWQQLVYDIKQEILEMSLKTSGHNDEAQRIFSHLKWFIQQKKYERDLTIKYSLIKDFCISDNK